MNDLKKLLYKLADAIAQEAEENPAFREKIEKALVSFAPTIQVQPPEKASDNPFELYRIDEGKTLEKYLKSLTVPNCKKLAKEYNIALPKGKANKADVIQAVISASAANASDNTAELVAEKRTGPDQSEAAPDFDKQTDTEQGKTAQGGEKQVDTEQSITAQGVEKQLNTEQDKNVIPYVPESKNAAQPAIKADEINPVRIYRAEGPEKLLALLTPLSADDLHTIIRINGMDTARRSVKWKNTSRLIDLIMNMAKSRATQGDVFLNYES